MLTAGASTSDCRLAQEAAPSCGTAIAATLVSPSTTAANTTWKSVPIFVPSGPANDMHRLSCGQVFARSKTQVAASCNASLATSKKTYPTMSGGAPT